MAVSLKEAEMGDKFRFFVLQAHEIIASLGTKVSHEEELLFLANSAADSEPKALGSVSLSIESNSMSPKN